MSLLMRCSAFYASYIPLYIMLGIKYFKWYKFTYTNLFIIILWSASIVSIIYLLLYIKFKFKRQKHSYYVTNIKKSPNGYTEYILTVILPLLAFDFNKIEQIICFIFIWIALGYLYVKYNQIKYNIFDFLGYTLFSCDLYSIEENLNGDTTRKYYANEVFALSRDKLRNYDNELFYICEMSDELLVVKNKKI